MRLIGSRALVLNNMGYSYLLRGDLEKSKVTLAAAYRTDPENPYVMGNIDLLNEKLAAANSEPLDVYDAG